LEILAIGLVLAVLVGFGFMTGAFYQKAQDAAGTVALRMENASLLNQIEVSRAYGEGVATAYAIQEEELIDLRTKRATDEKIFLDSLSVIRAMQPASAERAVAQYYERRRHK